MPQDTLIQQVAAATGEDLSVIRALGFSELSFGAIEVEPEEYLPPQVVDWDALELARC